MDEWEINKTLEQCYGTGGKIESGKGGRIGVVGSAPIPSSRARATARQVAALILLLAVSLMLPLVSLGKPELGSPREAHVVMTGHNMAASGGI